jgi:serine/threonine protein kinase
VPPSGPLPSAPLPMPPPSQAVPLAPPPAPSSQPTLAYPPPSAPGSSPNSFPSPKFIPVQFPQIGTVLTSARGAYQVRTVLGSGEFGAVYECIGPFDQVYAVKMMRPANRPYADVHAEWVREVQRLMSLRHPNVVYIHDAFVQNNLFYLALERCDHALTAMLGTAMQEGLVIELARQLLAAAQFLHDNDIVHDDLHPGNVLITHTTDRPVVKISDFGISYELRGASAVRPNVVHHAIMAPEILATGYTSKQSDIYQIGLLIYWMLTGRPAIDTQAPYAELVRQVADGDARMRAEAVATPFGALIAKMLRRREAYRYSTAREVWADLRELPAWQTRALFPAK